MRKVIYISLLLLIIAISCSVSRSYKTLSFFFDGVPEPADSIINIAPSIIIPETDPDKLITAIDKGDRMIYHQPYRIRGCNNCHLQSSVSEMKEKEPGLCYQCHENFNVKYEFIHGPVQGGFCTGCHNPHISNEKALLIVPADEICNKCHNSSNLSATTSHKMDNKGSCLDCHMPHGGSNNLMLRNK